MSPAVTVCEWCRLTSDLDPTPVWVIWFHQDLKFANESNFIFSDYLITWPQMTWYVTFNQPCTQRNIFGSHWLLNVQTLVARAKNELFWKQVSYFTDSACQYWSTVHKFLHHSHASPSSPSLLRLAPPPKKKNQRLLPLWHLSGKLINAAVAVKTLPRVLWIFMSRKPRVTVHLYIHCHLVLYMFRDVKSSDWPH